MYFDKKKMLNMQKNVKYIQVKISSCILVKLSLEGLKVVRIAKDDSRNEIPLSELY